MVEDVTEAHVKNTLRMLIRNLPIVTTFEEVYPEVVNGYDSYGSLE